MDRIRTTCAALLGLLAPVAACSGGSEGGPGIAPAGSVTRIVSLIPAATEILFALDAGDRLVGRTRWGIHPPEAREVADVGDGMRPSLEAVMAHDPDLVIVYDGAANAGVAERLESLGVATLTLRHDTFGDLEQNILTLGRVTGCVSGARRLVDWIGRALAQVTQAISDRPAVAVYFDAWAEPPITIGRGSFLDSLLTLSGARNVFGDLADSGPRVSLEAILQRDPSWILTTAPADSLESDPRLGERPGWDRIPAVRKGRVAVVDRDLIGRLGPRVGEAARQIARALHAEPSFAHDTSWTPACA